MDLRCGFRPRITSSHGSRGKEKPGNPRIAVTFAGVGGAFFRGIRVKLHQLSIKMPVA